MGVTLLDGGCGGSPALDCDKVACEGLLEYESRAGVWKQRWFVLDSDRLALVKCATSTRQRSRSYGSTLGGDVVIKDVHPLSPGRHASGEPASSGESVSASAGLAVTTPSGACIQFRTKSIEEETQWLSAVAKLSNGFSAGVGERLAERELLAGKYSLVRELGRGASGIVSLYTWQGKPFAIKKFVPQKAKGIPNRRIVAPGAGLQPTPGTPINGGGGASAVPDDIRREVALLKKASSLPYVIQLHDVILDPVRGEYYLVMEYMGGGAIAEWDAARKCYVSAKGNKSIQLLDTASVRRYATHLVLGVQALHRHRLCHRDIKPENVIASADRATCKIGDLGVAHYFREDTSGELYEEEDVGVIELWDIDVPLSPPSSSEVGITAGAGATADTAAQVSIASETAVATAADVAARRRGMLRSTKGTYQFLPPEALSGAAFCGFKADVWSIGVTLYALAFGFLPFYSPDVVELFEKIERAELVFPVECRDDELKHLLRGVLNKDPEQRLALDAILAHPWLHRDVDSKALQSEVRALKRSGALTIADHDLGSAVSVLPGGGGGGDSVDDDLALAANSAMIEVETTAVTGVTMATQLYVPRPIASASAELPKWLLRDTERIATQLHYDWCRAKYLNGWRHGAVRDDSARVHPFLLPMRELPRTEQDKNVRCVVETMRCVVALGCQLRAPPSARQRRVLGSSSAAMAMTMASAACASQSLDAPVLRTDDVVLSWEMLLLIDLLAENAHDVWASGYVAAGWTHGAHFDAAQQHHPSLRPYMALTEHEKDVSREAVASVLKTCICLGYGVTCTRRRFEC